MNPVHCVDNTVPKPSEDPGTTLPPDHKNASPDGGTRNPPVPLKAAEQPLSTNSNSSSWFGRWEVYRPRYGQHPTDAIENWRARARAEVDWFSTTTRMSDNRYIHTVIPYLSCVKGHPLLDDRGRTLTLSDVSYRQISTIISAKLQEWVVKNPSYELLDYCPYTGRNEAGQPTVSIMICYRLNYMPILDCQGVGPDVRTAKADAARKLLLSGHCMVHIPR